jgi:tetratricopeptide (TPR) repeat protein
MAAMLVLVTVALYWPATSYDFIHYDDPDYVTANPHVQGGLSWEGVRWAFGNTQQAAYWAPLMWLSHMLVCQVFGLNAWGHHLVNVLLHAATTALVFLVLRQMTGAMWRSILVAALFGLHPLRVESVAWIAERKDVLSGLFFFLTLWSYARYVEVQSAKPEVQSPKSKVQSPPASASNAPPPSRITHHASRFTFHVSRFTFHVSRFYLLSLFFFALGLMSKPTVVTLPCVLLLLDYWPLQRFHHSRARPLVMEKIPFFAHALAASLVTFMVQSHGGAVTRGENLPFGARGGNALISYCRYLEKMFWPTDLAIFYPHPGHWPMGKVLLAGGLLLAISALLIAKRRRYPFMLMGWLWFCGTLVPTIGLVQSGEQAMADRFTYLPSLGVLILVIWGATDFFIGRRFGPMVLAIAGGIGVAACALATHRQVKYWRDDLTVFEHALTVTGRSATAHYQVGTDLEQAGKYNLAIGHFQEALEADPTLTDAYYGQAYSLERLGRPEEALKKCQAALQVTPGLEWAHNRLSALLWKLGRHEEAMRQCAEALRFNPKSAEAHYNLGIALSDRGELAEAEAQLTEAARLKPDYGEAIIVLAEVLFKQGKVAEAEARFRESLALSPTNAEAHINLGGLLWGSGRREEAIQHYAEALRLSPAQPVAHYNMGTVLFAQGKLPEAVEQFAEAVRLRPNYTEALTELGRVLIAQGKLEEGLTRLREAAHLDPTNANLQVSLGNALMVAGQTNQAAACFVNALRLEPGLAEKLIQTGKSLAAKGQLSAALSRFRTALYLKPDDITALNDLARILATQPQAEVRDGPRAVLLAERACQLSGNKEARCLATLDMAYAEAGRFEDAIRAVKQTRNLAIATGDKQGARDAEARLDLYRKNQPYRQ